MTKFVYSSCDSTSDEEIMKKKKETLHDDETEVDQEEEPKKAPVPTMIKSNRNANSSMNKTKETVDPPKKRRKK